MLRNYWLSAREVVARRVPLRALALMDQYFDRAGYDHPDGPAVNFDAWPLEDLREIARLCGRGAAT